jgi:hypothetical protein
MLLGLAGACQREAGPGQATVPPAKQAPAHAAFAAGQQAWRDQRRAELTRPDGWTSLVGLHWIEPGAHYVGSAGDNGIRLAVGPAQLGMIDLRKDGVVRFVPAEGVALTLDDGPLQAPAVLRTDADEAGPSRLAFDDGKGLATVIERGGRRALRVKHADAPTRTAFAGLDYWPADASWKVDAKFIPHPAGKTIQIANIIGSLDDVPNPGVLEFERDGRIHRIEALDEGGDGLFLIIADRTSGHGSYGAGRYIDAPRPDARGRVAIDFNQAYNPPCAFTAFATCPLPPPENRLDLAVTAGEKIPSANTH